MSKLTDDDIESTVFKALMETPGGSKHEGWSRRIAEIVAPAVSARLQEDANRESASSHPVTNVEVEAAAEAVHYALGRDDYGVANEDEREEVQDIARAALLAAEKVRFPTNALYEKFEPTTPLEE